MLLKCISTQWFKRKDKNKTVYEYCVICHKKTEYLYNTPIQNRINYIVGCGQLCDKCYWEITHTK